MTPMDQQHLPDDDAARLAAIRPKAASDAQDTRPPELRKLVEHLAGTDAAVAGEEETPLVAEPTRPAAGVTFTSSYPQAGVHDGQDADANGAPLPGTEPPPEPASAGEFEVLEQNGFGAIRASMLSVVNDLGSLPPEALAAAVAYNDRARRRILARGNSDPRLREALKVVEVEARYLAFVARAHKDLRDLQARIEARAVVTG